MEGCVEVLVARGPGSEARMQAGQQLEPAKAIRATRGNTASLTTDVKGSLFREPARTHQAEQQKACHSHRAQIHTQIEI